jgi:hypothetical protein
MITERSGRLLTLIAAVALGVACMKCNSVEPQAEEPYYPVITNSWTDLNRSDHKFNLVAEQVNVQKGTFTGEEAYTDSIDTFPLSGEFSNRNISFTVTKRGRDTTYNGRFIADTLIDLGGLKLFRPNE